MPRSIQQAYPAAERSTVLRMSEYIFGNPSVPAFWQVLPRKLFPWASSSFSARSQSLPYCSVTVCVHSVNNGTKHCSWNFCVAFSRSIQLRYRLLFPDNQKSLLNTNHPIRLSDTYQMIEYFIIALIFITYCKGRRRYISFNSKTFYQAGCKAVLPAPRSPR